MSIDDGWMQTFGGRVFRYKTPDLSAIQIEDVAHSLALLCRFAGHVRQFYSVAQHSVHVREELLQRCEAEDVDEVETAELGYAALLHDVSEAYCVDIPHPLKMLPELSGYREIEECIEKAVQSAFLVSPTYAKHPWIKWADLRVLATERRDLLNTSDRQWSLRVPPSPRRIEAVEWREAEVLFLQTYSLAVSELEKTRKVVRNA